MSRKNVSNNSIATILSSLVILFLVVISLGYLIVRTDSFSSPSKGFYLKLGDDLIIADRDNMNVVLNKQYKFEIFSDFDLSETESAFSVSIVPNELYDFSFAPMQIATTSTTNPSGGSIVDSSNSDIVIADGTDEANPFLDGEKIEGLTYWSDFEYITDAFSISVYDDYFTLTASMDLDEIIHLYYPNKAYFVVRTAIDTGIPFFRLVVENSFSETININFNIKSE